MLTPLYLIFILLQEPVTPPAETLVFTVETFFELSPEMKAFLDEYVMIRVTEMDRLKSLLYNIFDKDKLNLEYSNNQTYTPKKTFAYRSGNCLSFTGMFISMARYCGLYAQFQEVSDISSWSQNGKFTIYNRHMNAIVFIDGRRMEVDFNYQIDKGFRMVHHATDSRAISHFYNNLGAEALAVATYPKARFYFEKAIEADPEFSQPWTNLGVFYRVTGDYKKAEELYLHAQELNRFDYTAKMNLAHLYELQGKKRQSDILKREIRHFRESNPYYHFALGKTAFDNGDFKKAVSHLKRAVRLHSTHPKFLVTLAAAYQKIGKLRKARKLVKKAKTQAKTQQEKVLYDLKLQLLFAEK